MMPGGWVDRKNVPRGPNGRGLCRWCSIEVPPRRFTFCSDYCVHEWKLRSQPGYLRDQILKRDRGVCVHCGLDTIKEHRKLKRARRHSPRAYAPLGIFDKNAQDSLGRGSHFAGNGRRRRVRPGQHSYPLPALPSRGNSSAAGANSPRQSSRYACRRSSRQPVEAIAEDGLTHRPCQTCCTSARTLLTVEATLSSIPPASLTSLRLSADNPG